MPCPPSQTLPAQDVINLRRAYYAAYSHMDAQVGRVVSALLNSSFANDTVISFFGDHGQWGAKWIVSEVRIYGIISLPCCRLAAGRAWGM